MNSEQNKRTVTDFYPLMFNESLPAEAITRFVGRDYIQHHPMLGHGKQAFIDCFERMARDYPGKRVHFVRGFADGNYIVLHTKQEWPET